MQKKTLTPDVVDIDGRATYYWQQNTGLKDHVVLILHGFMSDYRSMEPFAEYLDIDENTRVLLPDLPGFGASAIINDDPSIEDYVQWAIKFIDAVAPDSKKLTIIGYSFGAYIAIMLASQRSKVVNKLILITPVLQTSLPVKLYSNGLDSLASVSIRVAKKLYVWPFNFDFTTYYLMKTKDKERRQKLKLHRRQELETLRPELVINLYRTMNNVKLLPYARQIHAPVFVVMAKKDNLAFNYFTKRFINSLSDADAVTLDDMGHLIPFEEPELLASIVNQAGLD